MVLCLSCGSNTNDFQIEYFYVPILAIGTSHLVLALARWSKRSILLSPCAAVDGISIRHCRSELIYAANNDDGDFSNGLLSICVRALPAASSVSN